MKALSNIIQAAILVFIFTVILATCIEGQADAANMASAANTTNTYVKEPSTKATTLDWSRYKKVITVVGEVDGSILAKAQELEKQGGAPVIRVFINSPGGSVMMGNIFVQAMESAKARGSEIECAVSNLAASMAMHFFAHCTKRYILEGGYLLFHEPRVGIPQGGISPSEAMAIYMSLVAATLDLDVYLRRQLKLSDEEYDMHNKAQTLWTTGAFIRVIPSFKMSLVKDIKLPEGFPSAFDPIGRPSFLQFPVGNSPLLPYEIRY